MKKKLISAVIILSIIVICIVININSKDKTKIINYNGNNLLINIDGVSMDSLPTSGNYYLTSYECDNDNTKLSWNRTTYKLDISNGISSGGVYCNLTFKSNPLLNEMPVGSYVAYIGTGGTVGNTSVTCSGNACSGENANQVSDTSGYTYGWCYARNYKYYVTGWRIAYIKDNKVVLVSAGAPECLARVESDANETYIKTANAVALKYCNINFVDGNCVCVDENVDGLCDAQSTDAWAINDYDFYYMTKAISGVGKRLTSDSDAADSGLGDSTGGTLTTAYCLNQNSYKECGYNNDLIDIGGYYWFASRNTNSSTSSYYTNGVGLRPITRNIYSYTGAFAFGLRPMINLSSTVYITGGDGTMDSPYQIANS